MRQIAHYMLFACVLRLTSALPLAKASESLKASPTPSSKFVFSHHIVGNTFNYAPSTWSSDVALAFVSGIDGFALNIGNQPWEITQVRHAYDASLNSGTGFKMFLSLDMSSLPCNTMSDAHSLISLVRSLASHPSQFRFGPENKTFVSTFSGEQCTFSAASSSQGWAQHFVSPLSSEIHFVPSFFVDPTQLSTGDASGRGGFGGIINGDFNWNSAWPIQLTTTALTKLASNPLALASLLDLNVSGHSIASTILSVFSTPGKFSDAARAAFASVAGSFKGDEQHLNAIRVGGTMAGAGSAPLHKTYMAAVSPWFFAHFSRQTLNKNFLFLCDNHLYPKRWETLVAARDAVDLVEIVTWNDYGESHYIGPIEGMQPNSQAWVNGNNHTGWLELTAYYAKAFKSGVYPQIERDQIVMWARTHPRDAQASQDAVGRPTNFQLVDDAFWATILVPAPSTVTLSTPSAHNGTAPSPNTAPVARIFRIPAGVSHLKAHLVAGSGMRASVFRGGRMVLDLNPEGFVFNPSPRTYDFNAFVAASP